MWIVVTLMGIKGESSKSVHLLFGLSLKIIIIIYFAN